MTAPIYTPSPAILAALRAYQESVRDWVIRKPHLVAGHRAKLIQKAGVGATLAALELAVLDQVTERQL